MTQEILDNPNQLPPQLPHNPRPLKTIIWQLGIASCSLILYFLGYASLLLSAELGIGLIILTQFSLNYKARPFKSNKPIDILRFLGANMLLVGVFFQLIPYPTATILQSIGLIVLIIYFLTWALYKDTNQYFFWALKIMQAVSIASFCCTIRSYMLNEVNNWLSVNFLITLITLLLVTLYFFIYKIFHPKLFIHLPLVIWVFFIHLGYISTKLF